MANLANGILSDESNRTQKSRGVDTRNCTDSRPTRGKLAAAHAKVCTRHRLLRTLMDHLLWRSGHLEGSLLERKVVRTLAARWSYQVALGTFLKGVSEHLLSSKTSKSTVRWSPTRTIALSREFSITMFEASCCRDGSLAVIDTVTSKELPTFHRCLKGSRQLAPAHTRQAMPTPVATQFSLLNRLHLSAFILHLLVEYFHP